MSDKNGRVSNQPVNPNRNQKDIFPSLLKASMIVVVFAAIGILVLYFFQFKGSLGTQETFAQFGDFIGGTLNPILGFATVSLLIWSIRLQMKELRLTREELTATKEEAEKSRLALEGQVAHLEKEARLSELDRLLNIQLNKYQELLKNKVINQNNLRAELNIKKSPNELVTCESVIEGVIFDEVLDQEQIENLGIYINYLHCSGTKDGMQWQEIEQVGISIGELVKKYIEIYPSTEFRYVYLPQAKALLRDLYDCLGTGELIDANLNLDPSFNANRKNKYSETNFHVV
ncbi:hypothetical protein [Shewanella sp. 30m-9]